MRTYTFKITTAVIVIILFKCSVLFGQFTVYTPPTAINIRDIKFSVALSRVIIASDVGVFFFDGSSWTQTTTANGLPSDDVKCLAATPTGGVFTGTANGLAKWNGTSWIPYSLSTPFLFSFINAIYVNGSTDTLYGSDNGRLFTKGTGTTALNVNFTPAVGLFNDIGHMDIPGAYNFIVATSTNGAVIYDFPTGATFVVNTSSTPIPSNNILSHTIEGNKTYDGTDQGVYIPDFTNFPSTPHVTYNTSNSQLPSNIIQAVAVRNGVQWYGTPNGLAKHDATSWTIYDTLNSNLPSNNVIKLNYDSLGNTLWIGTADGKLSKFGTGLSTIEKANELANINVFPNPSSSSITITLSDLLFANNFHYKIISSLGEPIQMGILGSKTNTINISNLSIGIYSLIITNYNSVQSISFLKN
jgi:ligand-binding sensor domain-containing protein